MTTAGESTGKRQGIPGRQSTSIAGPGISLGTHKKMIINKTDWVVCFLQISGILHATSSGDAFLVRQQRT